MLAFTFLPFHGPLQLALINPVITMLTCKKVQTNENCTSIVLSLFLSGTGTLDLWGYHQRSNPLGLWKCKWLKNTLTTRPTGWWKHEKKFPIHTIIYNYVDESIRIEVIYHFFDEFKVQNSHYFLILIERTDLLSKQSYFVIYYCHNEWEILLEEIKKEGNQSVCNYEGA